VPPEYRCGFQRFIGFSRGHQYFDPIFYRDDDATPRTSSRYEPDVQTEHLVEIMADASKHGSPFFAMINYGLPHSPLMMPDCYAAMYDSADVLVRECTPEARVAQSRQFLARYYGLCTSVDDNVGRVLDWLDETGLTESTIVVFVSDHGEMAGEFDRGGKKVYYDSSMHVPLIVRWPGEIRSGQRIDTMVDPAVDIMPTVLELCGLDVPECVQGQSLAGLLTRGDASALRDYVFYEILMERDGPERFPNPERGIRTRDWLYVRQEGGPVALFDLCNDPLEMNNCVGHPAQAERVRELDSVLSRHMAETEDNWGIEAVFPPPDFMSHADASEYHRELLKRVIRDD